MFCNTMTLQTPNLRKKNEGRRYYYSCEITTTEYKWTTNNIEIIELKKSAFILISLRPTSLNRNVWYVGNLLISNFIIIGVKPYLNSERTFNIKWTFVSSDPINIDPIFQRIFDQGCLNMITRDTPLLYKFIMLLILYLTLLIYTYFQL